MSKLIPANIIAAIALSMAACASQPRISETALNNEPSPEVVSCDTETPCDSKLMQAYQYYRDLWGQIFLK